ncbi:carbohydrate kinase family protein [Pseudonocardia sp.]|uniref:carbohydrate kinase family protein n=1 Tax=Pseudonocardia sp. TaxID=60912 RepID=UPI003D140D81
MLTVIGDLAEDIIVRRAGPLTRGDDNPATIHRTRGGSGANVAAAAAGRVPVRFIGRVGDDAAGRSLVEELRRCGVDVRVQRAGVTATIVIIVDEAGERTMIPDRAAAAELGAVDPAWLADTSWLHLPLYGFLTEPSRTSLLGVLDVLRRDEAGPGVSVDLSTASVLGRLGAHGLRDVLDRVAPDVVFANEAVAADTRFAGLADPAPTVVVTRGPAPVLLRVRGTAVEVPVPAVPQVADTTGAGDAFAAGYLEAAMQRQPPASCAERGSLRAADVLVRGGPHRIAAPPGPSATSPRSRH